MQDWRNSELKEQRCMSPAHWENCQCGCYSPGHLQGGSGPGAMDAERKDKLETDSFQLIVVSLDRGQRSEVPKAGSSESEMTVWA